MNGSSEAAIKAWQTRRERYPPTGYKSREEDVEHTVPEKREKPSLEEQANNLEISTRLGIQGTRINDLAKDVDSLIEINHNTTIIAVIALIVSLLAIIVAFTV